jgi:hypothetical protein
MAKKASPEIKVIDWGDGQRVKVPRPKLEHLEAAVCSPTCYPDCGGGIQRDNGWTRAIKKKRPTPA